jgi:hypothetical protein
VTRRQTFTQAQLRAAAKIAKEHGVSVRLDPDGSATISPSSAPASDDELDRELEAFEALHDRHVPWTGPHLNHREEKVLKVLVAAEGRPLAASIIPLAGPRTVNGLLAYGLVGLVQGTEIFDRSQEIHATKEGLSFLRRREAHYERYPTL